MVSTITKTELMEDISLLTSNEPIIKAQQEEDEAQANDSDVREAAEAAFNELGEVMGASGMLLLEFSEPSSTNLEQEQQQRQRMASSPLGRLERSNSCSQATESCISSNSISNNSIMARSKEADANPDALSASVSATNLAPNTSTSTSALISVANNDNDNDEYIDSICHTLATTDAKPATTVGKLSHSSASSSSCISIIGATRASTGEDYLDTYTKQADISCPEFTSGSYKGELAPIAAAAATATKPSTLLSSSQLQLVERKPHQQQQQLQLEKKQTPTTTSSINGTSNSTNNNNNGVFGQGASRFFSSKLNTGSLWSLLSAGGGGGGSSSWTMNDSTSSSVDNTQQESIQNQEKLPTEMNALSQQQQQQQDSPTNNGNKDNKQQKRQPLESSRSTSSFFSRPFQSYSARVVSTISAASSTETVSVEPSATQQDQIQQSDKTDKTNTQQQQQQQQQMKKRQRFNVKYIGNTLLHKNFTLPMLEWIARDIKRQTIKGAQSINQRQFSIPARDIVFEIQANQLSGISCKDGHYIFVHPMHCVSKYVQLQHDPTCFAYIIRDSKEAPSFCHIFQAKSTLKIHEIFNTIREVATTRATNVLAAAAAAAASANQHQNHSHQHDQQTSSLSMLTNATGVGQQLLAPNKQIGPGSTIFSLAARGLQKSASTEGHWRSLLGHGGGASAGATSGDKAPLTGHNHHLPSGGCCDAYPSASAATGGGGGGGDPSCGASATANAISAANAEAVAAAAAASLQFENSYQFEVMFVKRVKLQVRRVPASFVDDALETLKSFEVPKAQIKGVVKKRIISASVDERQEYDEQQQQQDSTSKLKPQVANICSTNETETAEDQRRASSVSLNPASHHSTTTTTTGDEAHQATNEAQRESKSCQQSPTKSADVAKSDTSQANNGSKSSTSGINIANCLKSQSISDVLASVARSHEPTPTYSNDFSPYNTITSSDLNERIAAIPVVSGSSVSLDHETRQKLARQVRETIMATAANIKKGVYASGDKLDSSSSSKALDSLSCNVPLVDSGGPTGTEAVASLMIETPINDLEEQQAVEQQQVSSSGSPSKTNSNSEQQQQQRRSSALAAPIANTTGSPSSSSSSANQVSLSNNFDLFRRASARSQVIKNRTMLLLIGKDELCAISIDKHQMLFSKSFTSIVHCLQGISNRDHFGLICRDSGKINPQQESYAGFVFKCQSEKVVREIMGALRQVIYNSQHNYHAQDSPYNPLNYTLASGCGVPAAGKPTNQQKPGVPLTAAAAASATGCVGGLSPKNERLARQQTRGLSLDHHHHHQNSAISLTTKRGFNGAIPIGGAGIGEANSVLTRNSTRQHPTTAPIQNATTTTTGSSSNSFLATNKTQLQPATKQNPIKSMFCDDCPLYWFHRLCCDIESLPAEASKAIILRRIDSSLNEREQDEVLSKFSEFKIDSIDQHNEIFMSILRHLSERKQLRHNQSQSHHSALAKQQANAVLIANANAQLYQQQHQQQTRRSSSMQRDSATYADTVPSTSAEAATATTTTTTATSTSTSTSTTTAATTIANSICQQQVARAHQRSGSTSGSLAQLLVGGGGGGGGQQQQSAHLTDAMDNLKRAKNSISLSIENILKRRPSGVGGDGDESSEEAQNPPSSSGSLLLGRVGSFKGLHGRPSRPGSSLQCSNEVAAAGQPALIGDVATKLTCADNNSSSNLVQAGLRRSQSSTEYLPNNLQQQQQQQQQRQQLNWRDSLLTRTVFNAAADVDLASPLVGLFRRRGSSASSHRGEASSAASTSRTTTDLSIENLNTIDGGYEAGQNSISPITACRSRQSGASTPSGHTSLLSGSFWKKNIFDKIHQPSGDQQVTTTTATDATRTATVASEATPSETATTKRSKEQLRALWQKAIREQITLIKMDKQNQKLQEKNSAGATNRPAAGRFKPESPNEPGCSCDEDEQVAAAMATTTTDTVQSGGDDDDGIRKTMTGSISTGTTSCQSTMRIKLNYRDVPHVREAAQQWERRLKRDPTKKVEFVQVAGLIRFGVPKRLRGEIWMFLMNQYQLRHGTSFQPADCDYRGDANQAYRSLLSQLSTQQHEIFVDIGRTFPTHPYYSQYLSIGQLSLFNLLKAYSLLDQEVGYCQGLSFVAGILLLHVDSEDEAFELMRHLLFNFGLRKQYLPSMNALHLQLYQMTRLLRDHQYDIFNHFDKLDISPSLYAAPWFLTLFASQFPLGFVSRLLDLIFLVGIEAIFRVALTLLTFHREALLECSNLELTMQFLRNNLVQVEDKNLVRLFDDSMSLDLRNKLIEYEIEYSFYCAEDKARANQMNQQQRSGKQLDKIGHHRPKDNDQNGFNQNGKHQYQIESHQKSNNSNSSNKNKESSINTSTATVANSRSSSEDSSTDKDLEKLEFEDKQANDSSRQQYQQGQVRAQQIRSEVADATATVIIQHLLANNHLKSLNSDYSY